MATEEPNGTGVSNSVGAAPGYTSQEMAMTIGGVEPSTLQEILAEAIGFFAVLEVMVGANGITRKEGIITNVGVSYVILLDDIECTSILCDLYSIKFVTFYRKGRYPESYLKRRAANGGVTCIYAPNAPGGVIERPGAINSANVLPPSTHRRMGR